MLAPREHQARTVIFAFEDRFDVRSGEQTGKMVRIGWVFVDCDGDRLGDFDVQNVTSVLVGELELVQW